MNQPRSPLAQAALHKFLLINRYLRQYAGQMDERGLRPRQFSVLRFLLENGPATVGAVQEYLYRSPSTASTLLSQLEESGYVTRTRSEADNRVVIVALTDLGRQVAEQTPVGGIVLLRRRLDSLSEEQLGRMDAALADIMQLMEVTEQE